MQISFYVVDAMLAGGWCSPAWGLAREEGVAHSAPTLYSRLTYLLCRAGSQACPCAWDTGWLPGILTLSVPHMKTNFTLG